jgi:hypothetical protein
LAHYITREQILHRSTKMTMAKAAEEMVRVAAAPMPAVASDSVLHAAAVSGSVVVVVGCL